VNVLPPDRTDQELVTATLKDRHAFIFIVERYQEPLRRYARRLGCTDPSDAEDVLQEVFLKCFVNLNNYDPALKFSSWLYRIAHNETISLFRRKKVRPSPVATEEDLALFENLSDGKNLLDDLARESDATYLQSALGKVTEKYRTVLILRFFEEKSYTEISDIMEIPEGTVATYISRGKKELKGLLSKKSFHEKP
jgi:RNA polymerase sigma-70 factor (ECF subfamily)